MAVGLFLAVYIAIPDYPYQWKLWYSLPMDPNGFWHELWYVEIIPVAMIVGSMVWQLFGALLIAIRAWANVGSLLRLWLKRIEKDL